ncbi:aminotransferase [Pseudodonghicola flavimaris]|uniref:aspartate transaminase n=1 Tax=Pseudodonghicola flavimaris TaxID=3050036 RepID=A0ABT7EVS1_9RHOB|nr:aminotransferase [Pseudodonghicola flavimaris]MDK3016444.1 aminotransferase [Pseudodonghicola flavimaris]
MTQPKSPPHLSRTDATFSAPIVTSRRWIEGVSFPAGRPLINLSQAAPVEAPPESLRQAMAEYLLSTPQAHLYGPVLGMPELREELAAEIATRYDGSVGAAQVAITSGCNQAFAAAMAALTGEGDEVILPTPWYFNHKMWLDMSGVRAVPLPTDAAMLPDPDQAAALITPRTRAIVLITPNNPSGAEYPGGLVRAFYELAKSRGLKLIVDETYRDFDSREGRPHDLFSDPDWDRTFIHLYSFSKAYRLTGHRVGAMVTAPELLLGVEKFIDTVTICPSQIGQFAALTGIRTLGDWVRGERDEILARRDALAEGFGRLANLGWKLKGLGAYFAYVEHPFAEDAQSLAQRLVHDASLLTLPASMFVPQGDPTGARHLRLAFANTDSAGLAEVIDRLAALPV